MRRSTASRRRRAAPGPPPRRQRRRGPGRPAAAAAAPDRRRRPRTRSPGRRDCPAGQRSGPLHPCSDDRDRHRRAVHEPPPTSGRPGDRSCSRSPIGNHRRNPGAPAGSGRRDVSRAGPAGGHPRGVADDARIRATCVTVDVRRVRALDDLPAAEAADLLRGARGGRCGAGMVDPPPAEEVRRYWRRSGSAARGDAALVVALDPRADGRRLAGLGTGGATPAPRIVCTPTSRRSPSPHGRRAAASAGRS